MHFDNEGETESESFHLVSQIKDFSHSDELLGHKDPVSVVVVSLVNLQNKVPDVVAESRQFGEEALQVVQGPTALGGEETGQVGPVHRRLGRQLVVRDQLVLIDKPWKRILISCVGSYFLVLCYRNEKSAVIT